MLIFPIVAQVPPPALFRILSRLFAKSTFAKTLLFTAECVDPYGTFGIRDKARLETAISIGIGETAQPGLDWYLGASGAIGYLDKKSCPLDSAHIGTLRGAALASCLGAAATFRSALGLVTSPRKLSCWNYKEGADAQTGPETICPLDVGSTLLVGTGAVGSALIYWLHLFGVSGSWTALDADLVEVNNTNRQLLFTPADAGWPKGIRNQKVEIASRFLPNCQWHPCWYDECEKIKNIKYDVILALANEKDVRTRLAKRNAAVLLHATTGENWLSQLHRHILGVDDCITCRTNDIRAPRFGCSTSALPADISSSAPDAALPFLSAASGLMLATALQALQLGDLDKAESNDWRWHFDSPHKMASSPVVKVMLVRP